MNIPMVDLTEQYKKIKKEINREINKVLDTGRFIMGPNVENFNKEMAEYTDTKYGIGCASGTDALLLSLMAIDLKPDHEVITTPFTFVATVEVIALLGAKPVFVDIEEDSYLIDPDKLENAVTDRTKAIIPVHLYGQSADMDRINKIAKEYNLYVIEDACQAVGAKYKSKSVCSLGDFGCLSYFPAKNLGAFGDGGHVLTSNKELAEKVRILMDHGSDKRYHHSLLGINSRLDALQAAVLRVKLKHIDNWNEARKDRAALYTELLKDAKVQTPVIKEYNDHVFHQYSIQVEDRNGLQNYLKDAGIATAIHYPIPLHLQPAYTHLSQGKGSFPVSEKTAEHIISLPMYPELKEKEIQYITQKIIEYTE